MFPVFRRYAGLGAALLFTSGNAYGETIDEHQGDRLYYASLDATEYKNLLEEGFSVIDHVVEDTACRYRTVWLGIKLKSCGVS